MRRGRPRPTRWATHAAGVPGLVVEFEGAEIEFRASVTGGNPGDTFFKDQFKNADTDKNGALDITEVRANFS